LDPVQKQRVVGGSATPMGSYEIGLLSVTNPIRISIDDTKQIG